MSDDKTTDTDTSGIELFPDLKPRKRENPVAQEVELDDAEIEIQDEQDADEVELAEADLEEKASVGWMEESWDDKTPARPSPIPPSAPVIAEPTKRASLPPPRNAKPSVPPPRAERASAPPPSAPPPARVSAPPPPAIATARVHALPPPPAPPRTAMPSVPPMVMAPEAAPAQRSALPWIATGGLAAAAMVAIGIVGALAVSGGLPGNAASSTAAAASPPTITQVGTLPITVEGIVSRTRTNLERTVVADSSAPTHEDALSVENLELDAPKDEASKEQPKTSAKKTPKAKKQSKKQAATKADANANLGYLSISSVPPARLIVDGHPMGMTPMRVRVAPGAHTIVVAHPTAGRKVVSASVGAGATRSVAVSF